MSAADMIAVLSNGAGMRVGAVLIRESKREEGGGSGIDVVR